MVQGQMMPGRGMGQSCDLSGGAGPAAAHTLGGPGGGGGAHAHTYNIYNFPT